MTNTIAEEIQQQAKELRENLYGGNVEEIRRKLIAFHAVAMKTVGGADSFIDPILVSLIKSKYTTPIVVVVLGTLYAL